MLGHDLPPPFLVEFFCGFFFRRGGGGRWVDPFRDESQIHYGVNDVVFLVVDLWVKIEKLGKDDGSEKRGVGKSDQTSIDLRLKRGGMDVF